MEPHQDVNQDKQESVELGESGQRHSSGLKGNKRRTRKDEEGRDYFCLCGKSYLSYPALYTHIKTKHQGKVNTYLIKNSNQTTTRNLTHKQPQEETKQLFNKEDLQQLKMLLTKYFPERYRATPIVQILQNLYQPQRSYIKPLLKFWDETQKDSNKNDENQDRKNKQKDKKNGQHYSADCVFGRFLVDMNKRVNLQCITFLIRFVIMIRRSISAVKVNNKYCQENTALMVPTIFNDLILEKMLSQQNYGKNPNFLINDKCGQIKAEPILEQEKIVCKILNFFANWLYTNNYTNYTVRYKQDKV